MSAINKGRFQRLSTYTLLASVAFSPLSHAQLLGNIVKSTGLSQTVVDITSIDLATTAATIDGALGGQGNLPDPLQMDSSQLQNLLNLDSEVAGEEASFIPEITEPLGEALAPVVDAVDTGLDPVTDALDDQVLEPVLDEAVVIVEPALDALQPLTNPLDGTIADLTGGSIEDALVNSDENTADGNGVVNDLLGGSATGSDSDTAEPDTDTVEQGAEESLLPELTIPLGEALAPVIDAVDTGLDPVTDALDEQIFEPVLDEVVVIIEPALDALQPLTNPLDGTVADLTGGSIEDALVNSDENTADGNGVVNDLLGGSATGSDSDTTEPDTDTVEQGAEESLLPELTIPLGEALAPVIDAVDAGLDPVTDALDDQVLEPVLDEAVVIVEPALDALQPLTNPLDGTVDDLTGGSVEDALVNSDDNTADGNGLVNDLLGGGNSNDDGTEASDDTAPLAPITEPLGEALAPLVDAIDSGLDPVTDPIDQQVLEAVLDALNPVLEPLLDALAPIIAAIDEVVADLTGGSVSDALSNTDNNTADGNGLVNDALGGNAPNDDAAEQGSDESPLAPVTEPLGESLEQLVSAVDTALDPITDPLDEQLEQVVTALEPATEPALDALEPVVTPVDATVADLTGGSVADALTSQDNNTEDGSGLVNDVLGGAETGPVGEDGTEISPLPVVTEPAGEALAAVVDPVAEALSPVTEPLDEQLEAVLNAAEPGTAPVLDELEPATNPVDGATQDLTGGSVEDALTTNDDNTADGSGLTRDVLVGTQAVQRALVVVDDQPALLALNNLDAMELDTCLDEDADGVCASKDQCPDTKAGQAVFGNGCTLDDLEPMVLEGVFFDTNKATLKQESFATLDEAALYIKSAQGASFEIAGHTDSRSSATYNLDLSQQRAEAVVAYLVSKNIDAGRLVAAGYGEGRPIADNTSDAGLAKNRRVEIKQF